MADIQVRLNRYREAALEAFEENLTKIVKKAQDATLDQLMSELVIENGVIVRIPANLRLLRRANQIFMTEMKKAGYVDLVNSFVTSFPSHLPLMQEQIEAISKQLKEPLPDLDFNLQDLSVLKSVVITDAKLIRDTITSEAAKATQQVLFSVGGLKFSEMTKIITDKLGVVTSKAKVIADTAQARFYRVALERQYEKIEAGTGKKILYRYDGVRDKRNRPFCANLLAQNKTYTREEIDKMDNHQLPNVFLTGGGWLCRQQWSLAGFIQDAEDAAAA